MTTTPHPDTIAYENAEENVIDWEAVTMAASERAGYHPETWRTAQDVVRAAIEIERETWEVSARWLRTRLDDGTDLDGLLRAAERLLDDLNVTSEDVYA